MPNNILFLGTGTSTGVPYLGCGCKTCRSNDQRDKRLRASALVTYEGKRFLIDAGPDLRKQLLDNDVFELDAILLTHEHYDHVGGLDDVRPLGEVQIYGESDVLSAIHRVMPYAFTRHKFSGIPELQLHEIDEKPFFVEGVEIVPIRVMHAMLPILGFRIGDLAYLTDVKTVPEAELDKLKNLKVLVVNALREREHFSHFTLDEAVEFAQKVGAETTWFTHISHDLGLYSEVERNLPENIHLAFDNLSINF